MGVAIEYILDQIEQWGVPSVRLSAEHYDSCVDYCMARSVRLQARKRESRWLIEQALEDVAYLGYGEESLEGALAARAKKRYGNPIVVYILLYVVIPVVVKLVIEWWFKNRELCYGFDRDGEGCVKAD